MTTTIEWAPFTLAPGTDDAALLQASADLQADFLARQPGFVRRDLLKGADGQWIDLVYWDSPGAAEAAMQRAATSPVCHRYFQLMTAADHDPGAGVSLFSLIREYSAEDAGPGAGSHSDGGGAGSG